MNHRKVGLQKTRCFRLESRRNLNHPGQNFYKTLEGQNNFAVSNLLYLITESDVSIASWQNFLHNSGSIYHWCKGFVLVFGAVQATFNQSGGISLIKRMLHLNVHDQKTLFNIGHQIRFYIISLVWTVEILLTTLYQATLNW